MSSLAGKVVAVTGASGGIGRALAATMAEFGARLLLNALDDSYLPALVEAHGASAEIVPGNIAEPAVACRLLAAGIERFGQVDVLINNAGIFYNQTVSAIDLDEIDRMIALNFSAVVRNSYLFARPMLERGSGHIINVSSISANLTTPGCGVYAGTKRAVEQFTDALRIELAGSGVRVGLIAPGRTDTALFDRMPAAPRASAAPDITPLAPADIAAGVRFMLEQPPHANVPHLRLYPAEQRS